MSNVKIIQDLYAAFAARDGETLRRILSPDIEWIQNEGFPGGGHHCGLENVFVNVFARFRAEWSSWRAEVRECLDAGETVVALGEYRGVHGATGKACVAAFAHVYDLRDGRVVRFRQYTDTAMVAEAMRPGE